MIGNNPVARQLIIARIFAGDRLRGIDQRLKRIDFIIVMRALHDRRNAFQPHACVNRRLWQRRTFTAFLLVILHENEVPNFDKPVAIFIGTARGTARNMVAMIVEYLGARTAWSRRTHRPKIIISRNADNAIFGQS